MPKALFNMHVKTPLFLQSIVMTWAIPTMLCAQYGGVHHDLPDPQWPMGPVHP